MTRPFTGSLKIPVKTASPSCMTALGRPTLTERSFIPVSIRKPSFAAGEFSSMCWATLHAEHRAKSRLAAHHVVISLRRTLQRKDFIHRPHAALSAECERILRIDGAAGRPAQDRTASHEQRYPRDLKRLSSRPQDDQFPVDRQTA